MFVFTKFDYNFKISNHFKKQRQTDPETEVELLLWQEMKLSMREEPFSASKHNKNDKKRK